MNQYRLKYSLLESISNLTDLNSSFSLGSMKVAYTGKNYNHTAISRSAFESCASTMFNCPIVANYDVISDEIGGHDMAVVDTDNGQRTINITEPVGVIPESATYRWETLEDNGVKHDYFCIDGVILWKRQPCYSKLVTNGITSQSIEIAVTDGTMVDGIFNIEKFEFEAFCLLERDEPCFEQASLQVFTKDEFKKQWQEMMREYTSSLEDNKNEGGKPVPDEVNKNIEQPIGEQVGDPAPAEHIAEDSTPPIEGNGSVEEVSVTETFSMTANQVRTALQTALAALISDDERGRYYIEDWDDREVYVMDWETCKIYGYAYTLSGDIATIDASSAKEKKLAYVDLEDGTESNSTLADIISEIVESSNASLSASYDAQIGELNTTIAGLKDTVSVLETFKKERLDAERSAAETTLFAQFDPQLKGCDEYSKLKEHASDYSIEDLQTQCYALVGKKNFVFSKDNTMTTNRIPVEHDLIEPGIDVYGGLLKNKKRI